MSKAHLKAPSSEHGTGVHSIPDAQQGAVPHWRIHTAELLGQACAGCALLPQDRSGSQWRPLSQAEPQGLAQLPEPMLGMRACRRPPRGQCAARCHRRRLSRRRLAAGRGWCAGGVRRGRGRDRLRRRPGRQVAHDVDARLHGCSLRLCSLRPRLHQEAENAYGDKGFLLGVSPLTLMLAGCPGACMQVVDGVRLHVCSHPGLR